MDKRLINYLNLKIYLRKTGKTLDFTPEELYNITFKDQEIITQALNKTPRLCPGQPVHPINNNSKCKPINFHDPIINNYGYNDYVLLSDINNELYYPNHIRKSIGYDSTSSHHFNILDDEYQAPNHTVMYFPRGGESSRINNKINKRDNRFINKKMNNIK